MARPLIPDETYAVEAELFRAISAGDRSPVQSASVRTKVSRQTVQRILKRLVDRGDVSATGKTLARRYRVEEVLLNEIVVPISGLDESSIWRENFQRFFAVPHSTAMSLSNFAATEMINNAIDHSGGTFVAIAAKRQGAMIQVSITDNGIGIFRRIQEHFQLDDIRHAVLDLTKGKLTTDPARHSGLGIFFSSRACAQFAIMANNLMLTHLGSGNDYLLDAGDFDSGTYVSMRFPMQSDMTLAQLFDKYAADGSAGFDKTIVPISLAEFGQESLISRSQAKRVLVRIDRFKEAIFDFEDVSTVGQAFADEIFRVFAIAHPSVKLRVANANSDVKRMIELALIGLREHSPDAPVAEFI